MDFVLWLVGATMMVVGFMIFTAATVTRSWRERPGTRHAAILDDLFTDADAEAEMRREERRWEAPVALMYRVALKRSNAESAKEVEDARRRSVVERAHRGSERRSADRARAQWFRSHGLGLLA